MKTSGIEIRAYSNPAVSGNMNFAAILPSDATGTVYWYVDQAYFTSNGLTGANGLLTAVELTVSPAGTHLITAVYSGNGTYLPSATVVTQVTT